MSLRRLNLFSYKSVIKSGVSGKMKILSSDEETITMEGCSGHSPAETCTCSGLCVLGLVPSKSMWLINAMPHCVCVWTGM